MLVSSDDGGSSLDLVQAGPFLRWAGSKRWLVRSLHEYMPFEYNDYYEPFLGSGAIFFSLAQGHRAFLSDTIEPLISAYLGVRKAPEKVHSIASAWATDRDTYYDVRGRKYNSLEYSAARFIYLNRLCFNGLYRVNRTGGFNVPYGRPRATNIVTNSGLLVACADRLRTADISVNDFEVATAHCRPRDLVYFDPPYVAGHRSNGFVDYNATIFDWDDQQRLADVFHNLDSRGVYVILTNADHESVRNLYKDDFIVDVARHSNMSSRTSTRGPSSEIVVLGRHTAAAGAQ